MRQKDVVFLRAIKCAAVLAMTSTSAVTHPALNPYVQVLLFCSCEPLCPVFVALALSLSLPELCFGQAWQLTPYSVTLCSSTQGPCMVNSASSWPTH